MKALYINQRLLVWIYFCSNDEFHGKWRNLVRIIFSLSVHFISTSCFPSSLPYVFKYLHVDLEESLFALFQIATSTGCIYFSIHAFSFRHRFARLFETLSEIYDESNWLKNTTKQNQVKTRKLNLILDANERSFWILASANDFGGWICINYYKIMGAISCSSIVTSFVSIWACCKFEFCNWKLF